MTVYFTIPFSADTPDGDKLFTDSLASIAVALKAHPDAKVGAVMIGNEFVDSWICMICKATADFQADTS